MCHNTVKQKGKMVSLIVAKIKEHIFLIPCNLVGVKRTVSVISGD